jgi:hypothetical protein
MYIKSEDPYDLHTHIRNILNNQYMNIKNKKIVDMLEIMYMKFIQDVKNRESYFSNDYNSEFFSALMDIYLLARIFRDYETTKRNSFRNEPVKRAIIVSGSLHSITYNHFFESIKGKIYSKSSLGNILIYYKHHQCIFVPVKDGTLSLSFDKGYHVEMPSGNPQVSPVKPDFLLYIPPVKAQTLMPIKKLHDEKAEKRIVDISPSKEYEMYSGMYGICGFTRIDGSKCRELVLSIDSSCMGQGKKCSPRPRCEKHTFIAKEVPYDYMINIFYKIKLNSKQRTIIKHFEKILVDHDIDNSIEPKYTQFERLVKLVERKNDFKRVNFNFMFLDFIVNKLQSFIKSIKLDYNEVLFKRIHDELSKIIFLKYIYAAETSYDAKSVLEVVKICPKIWMNALQDDLVMFKYVKTHQKPTKLNFKKWLDFQNLNSKLTAGEYLTEKESNKLEKLRAENNTWIFSNLKEPIYF